MSCQSGETARNPCACGRRALSSGIRQERVGKKHWRIHDTYECYDVHDGIKKTLKRREVTSRCKDLPPDLAALEQDICE